jgi:hypothetical protein
MGGKKSRNKAAAISKKNQEIMRIYKKKKMLNFISTLIIFGTAFFAVWFSNNSTSFPADMRTAIVIAICAVTLGALAFSFYNWRCPSCGKHLGRAVDPQTCRKCGYKFR